MAASDTSFADVKAAVALARVSVAAARAPCSPLGLAGAVDGAPATAEGPRPSAAALLRAVVAIAARPLRQLRQRAPRLRLACTYIDVLIPIVWLLREAAMAWLGVVASVTLAMLTLHVHVVTGVPSAPTAALFGPPAPHAAAALPVPKTTPVVVAYVCAAGGASVCAAELSSCLAFPVNSDLGAPLDRATLACTICWPAALQCYSDCASTPADFSRGCTAACPSATWGSVCAPPLNTITAASVSASVSASASAAAAAARGR